MEILYHEMKKLACSAVLWAFLAACLLFNTFLIAADSSGNTYANYVGTAGRQTGYVLGKDFNKRLDEQTAVGEDKQRLSRLRLETSEIKDVFSDFNTSEKIGDQYISALGLNGHLAFLMRAKYQALQKSVDEKAARGESMTLYFAGETYNMHQLLFNGLMRWLTTEGILVSALLMLLSIGFESMHRTDQIVYSTRTGRRVLWQKFAASVLIGLAAYLIMTSATLSVYFAMNHYGSIRDSSVSSAFNYLMDFICGQKPFITWQSFTIPTYLLAVAAASCGLILCFMLEAFVIGVLQKNSYISFILFMIIDAALLLLPSLLPHMNPALFISVLNPVSLWYKQYLWFTDGGPDILWPHFEMVGIVISLCFLVIFCILSARYFRKKDLI